MRCLKVKGTRLVCAGRAAPGALGLEQSVAGYLLPSIPQVVPEPRPFQEVVLPPPLTTPCPLSYSAAPLPTLHGVQGEADLTGF